MPPCGYGEIGRRTRLRIWRREACRFDSYYPHKVKSECESHSLLTSLHTPSQTHTVLPSTLPCSFGACSNGIVRAPSAQTHTVLPSSEKSYLTSAKFFPSSVLLPIHPPTYPNIEPFGLVGGQSLQPDNHKSSL